MLSRGHPVGKDDLFRLPYGGPALSADDIREFYSAFLARMDGSSPRWCLLHYYERNPVNGIYEFRDSYAEKKIGDIIGLDLTVVTTGTSVEKEVEEEAAAREEEAGTKLTKEAGSWSRRVFGNV